MPAPWLSLGFMGMLTALVLGGCATPAPPSPHPPGLVAPASPASPPSEAREWLGRFSVGIRSDRPDEAAQLHVGRFGLKSGALGLDLVLESPLGQTIARAGQAGSRPAWLELADGQRWEGDTVDEVVARSLGYPLPVGRLALWLDQRFDEVLERDTAGAIVSAKDSGWQIRVSPPRWRFERRLPEGLVTVVLVLDP